MNKERVTYTDEEFEGLEEKELHAHINNPPKVNKKKATELGAGQSVNQTGGRPDWVEAISKTSSVKPCWIDFYHC